MTHSNALQLAWSRPTRDMDTQNRAHSSSELDGFEKLYQDHNKMIRSVMFNICGARDLDDLVQETFLRIWKGLPRFNQRSQIKTWIYRITVNTALDHCRKAKKWKQETELKKDVHDRRSDESRMVNQDLVQKGLNQLPEIHRAVLVLATMQGLSINEIAGIVKASEGTVKSRLHYAKKNFLQFLEEQGVSL